MAKCGRLATGFPSASLRRSPRFAGLAWRFVIFEILHPSLPEMKRHEGLPSFPQHVMNVSSQTFRKHFFQWRLGIICAGIGTPERRGVLAAPLVALLTGCCWLGLESSNGQHITIQFLWTTAAGSKWEVSTFHYVVRQGGIVSGEEVCKLWIIMIHPSPMYCTIHIRFDSSEVGRWNYQQLGCHCKLLGGSWKLVTSR